MDKKYFDVLMESLEDAAAFSKGDASRARVTPQILRRTEVQGISCSCDKKD